MASTPTSPSPDESRSDEMRLPDDPSRWTRGDWAFDPKTDKAWEDPNILRRLIGTAEELEAVAEAIIKNKPLRCFDPEHNDVEIVGEVGRGSYQGYGLTPLVMVINLHDLIEAVQNHDGVRLAQIDYDEDKQQIQIKNRWVSDCDDNKTTDKACSTLLLWHCVVVSTCKEHNEYSKIKIKITLWLSVMFVADAWFDFAHFNAEVWFDDTCFKSRVSFTMTRFMDKADFISVRFTACASFTSVHFTAVVLFAFARFAKRAKFVFTHFYGKAVFLNTQFSALAWFGGASFDTGANFCGAHFDADAEFKEIILQHQASIYFTGARFAQSVRFDDDLNDTEPIIEGKIFFTDATLDERLTFKGTRFGKDARLGFNGFLARGGATVELSEDQLRLTRPQLKDKPWKRIFMRFWDYSAFDKKQIIMEGGDSDDPEAIDRAADDYELLAANYANQPARDKEEDGCRLMAHELRRQAYKKRTKAIWNDFFTGDLEKTSPRLLYNWKKRPLLWYLEYYVQLGVFLWHVVRHWIWKWGIKRTAIGYLLQPYRIVISGLSLLIVCAVIYGLCAGVCTVTQGGGPVTNPPWEADGLWGRAIFGLYFSMTTFVTLGYGDYAPASWFKLVTGIEALLGVTLLALFTVAWGRKLVR